MERNRILKRLIIIAVVLTVAYPIWGVFLCEAQVAYLSSYWKNMNESATRQHMSVKEFQEATKGPIDPQDWVIEGREMYGYYPTTPACIFGRYVFYVDLTLDAKNHITFGKWGVNQIAF
jgi:hypothetical protein